MSHSATKLGAWLKAHRQEKGIVARVFAGQIALSPAEYAEVEAGVGAWIGNKQLGLVVKTLGLSEKEAAELAALLKESRKAKPLAFEDVYTRDQLEPVRYRTQGKRMGEREMTEVLDAVFKPLQ